MAEVVDLNRERAERSGGLQAAPENSRVTPSVEYMASVDLYADEEGDITCHLQPNPFGPLPAVDQPEGMRAVADAMVRAAAALLRGADKLERDSAPA